jgi:hypothetical protein
MLAYGKQENNGVVNVESKRRGQMDKEQKKAAQDVDSCARLAFGEAALGRRRGKKRKAGGRQTPRNESGTVSRT